MDLFLLRHGIAVDRDHPRCPPDPDRPLTAKGIEKVRKVGRFMRNLELDFDAVLSSPWLRAIQTAKIICKELALEKRLQVSELLIPGHSPDETLKVLSLAGKEKRTILLVGHEPSLSTLATRLLAAEGRLVIKLRKAGLCRIHLDEIGKGHPAVLHWLLSPETMI